MNKHQLFALATVLSLCVAGPSYADDRKNESRQWDRQEQRYERDRGRNDERHWDSRGRNNERNWNNRGRNDERYWSDRGRNEWRGDRGRDDRRRNNWFRDNGYGRLSIPARYYPAPGQCRFWYPDLPAWRQPAAQWNCGGAPRGAWLIRHPRHDLNHVHVVVSEPWSYGPQLVGEFEIGSGTFIRLVADF